MSRFTPFLWFDTEGEDAAKFYVSVFPNSKIVNTTRFEGEVAKMAQKPDGAVLTVEFELDGNPFVALNGGPQYKINEGVSFSVPCNSQAEIDKYWDALTVGGETMACGWLRDRFGLCWQIVPSEIGTWMSDPKNGPAVAGALMQMIKLDYDALKKAYEG